MENTKPVATVTVTGRYTGGALFYPKQSDVDKAPKYSALVVLDDGEAKKIEVAKAAAMAEKWNGKPPAGLQDWTVRVGDDPEFVSFGRSYINPKANASTAKGGEKKRPGTYVRRDGAFYLVEEEDEVFYPGCYVAAEVKVYCYDGDRAKNIKPGVTMSLEKVLFLKDGDRLTTSTPVDKAFEGFDSEIDAYQAKGSAQAQASGTDW